MASEYSESHSELDDRIQNRIDECVVGHYLDMELFEAFVLELEGDFRQHMADYKSVLDLEYDFDQFKDEFSVYIGFLTAAREALARQELED